MEETGFEELCIEGVGWGGSCRGDCGTVSCSLERKQLRELPRFPFTEVGVDCGLDIVSSDPDIFG